MHLENLVLMILLGAQADFAAEGDAMQEDNVDILDGEQAQEEQPPADRPRITTRYMTKYEKARVLGTRALQIRYAGLTGASRALAQHCPAVLPCPAVLTCVM
jgi:hypothetical protein